VLGLLVILPQVFGGAVEEGSGLWVRSGCERELDELGSGIRIWIPDGRSLKI
jgi:hypothetical protein